MTEDEMELLLNTWLQGSQPQPLPEEEPAAPTAPNLEGKVITSCRDCVFAEYEGNEQTGCEWDRLDEFEENGAEIVGQDDGEKRYFLVVGRYCNACRHTTWGERHASSLWGSIVAKEFQVRVHFIIYVDESTTMEEVERTLDSVMDQGPVEPWGLTIIVNTTAEDDRPYLRLIRRKQVACLWEVRHMAPEDDGTQPGYGVAIDTALDYVKTALFYTVGRAGYVWPPNFLTVVNQAVNYEMLRLIAILPDADGNGLLMQVGLHKNQLGGYRKGNILDSLSEIGTELGETNLIARWDEIKDLSCM